MPRFHILTVAKGTEDDGAIVGDRWGFETPQAAREEIEALKRAKGGTYRIAPAPTDREIWDAEQRENMRLLDGTYKSLPVGVTSAWNHFIHLAQDPTRAAEGWIAYTPSVFHLVQDRQVSMPLSRYLTKHYGHDYSPDKAARAMQRLINAQKPMTLRFTRDPAEMRRAYIGSGLKSESSGYVSCMNYGPKHFDLPEDMHPCDAYSGRDSTLSMAILEDASGDIVARSIVAEGRKFYVRVYGVGENARRALEDKLAEAGYTKRCDYAGERIHLHPFPGGDDGDVIMPYIDGVANHVSEDGYIVRPRDEAAYYDGETTQGRASPIHSPATCDRCGEECHEDDLRDVDGENWCEYCRDNHAGYCEFNGVHTAEGVVEVVTRTRWGRIVETWSESAAEEHAFCCERTGWHYSDAGFTSIDVETAEGTQVWCAEDTREHVGRDDDDNLYSLDNPPSRINDDNQDELPEAA